MIATGCEDRYKVPVPEDRTCPKCGREVEVFTSKGRIVEDAICDCGYVFEEQKQMIIFPEGESDKK